MNHIPCDILRRWLVNEGHFEAFDSGLNWALFKTFMPDTAGLPSRIAAIYDDPPVIDSRLMSDGSVLQHYRVRLEARTSDYAVGWVKMQDVMTALADIHQEVVTMEGGDAYTIGSLTNFGGVIAHGLDDKQRHFFSLSMSMTVTQN